MAPNEAQTAATQIDNYLDVAMFTLVFHDYLINFSDEVSLTKTSPFVALAQLNLIWHIVKKYPKALNRALCLGKAYVRHMMSIRPMGGFTQILIRIGPPKLRYGGLLYALFAALPHAGVASHQLGLVDIILEYMILDFCLFLSLEWMMTARVCAMYGHSKKAQHFLLFCLLLEQVMCAVPTITFMRGVSFDAVQGLVPGRSTCVFEPTMLDIAQADAANVACMLYQFFLFLMVAFSLKRHIKEQAGMKVWSTKEFYTLLVQEHVLYFIFGSMLVAELFGIVSFEEPSISSATQ
ncbi:hypothetical protein CONPUDRAFT_145670, partial [Coniophora puteana RWD-64-598 SS2]